jgi:hypothetical protein
MSVLYVTEYTMPHPSYISGGVLPGMGVTQAVTYSTTAQSTAFASTTGLIRIHSKTAFSFLIGADPTATTSHPRVPAEGQLLIVVSPGHKIAAIDNT